MPVAITRTDLSARAFRVAAAKAQEAKAARRKLAVALMLGDETGTVNVIVGKTRSDRCRHAVIASRVTGRLQREGPITHVIAEEVEDISDMLDQLLAEDDRAGPLVAAPPARPPNFDTSERDLSGFRVSAFDISMGWLGMMGRFPEIL